MSNKRHIFKDPRSFFGSADVEGMKSGTNLILQRAAKVAKSKVNVWVGEGILSVLDDGEMLKIERAADSLVDHYYCAFNQPLDLDCDNFGLDEESMPTLVNYCSSFMNIKVCGYNDSSRGVEYVLKFKHGLPTSNAPEQSYTKIVKSGTGVDWTFDSSLFYHHTSDIPYSYFHEKLCELSLQYPQKQFVLCIQNDITKPEEATVYVYQNGEKK